MRRYASYTLLAAAVLTFSTPTIDNVAQVIAGTTLLLAGLHLSEPTP